MEETIVDFLISTIQSLAEQYPDATWVGVLLGVLLSICGVAAVATMWMPAPTESTGVYPTLYRWVHALAGHFAQNKGALADAKTAEVQQAVKAVTGK